MSDNGHRRPSPKNGDDHGSGSVECRRCGTVAPPSGKGQCDECGAMLPGNKVSEIHGAYSAPLLANAEHSELYRAWEVDLGDDLSAGDRAILRRAAECDRICQSAFDYLARSRESLASKRVQAALQAHATHAGLLIRAAQTLGLKRKARAVSPEQWIAEQSRGASR